MGISKMALLKVEPEWTLEQGRVYNECICRDVYKYGYHSGIIGSVVSTGSSFHDLDIVILPFISDGKHPETNKSGIREYLLSLGAEYSDDPKYAPAEGDLYREFWQLMIKDKIVDFFLYD